MSKHLKRYCKQCKFARYVQETLYCLHEDMAYAVGAWDVACDDFRMASKDALARRIKAFRGIPETVEPFI
jgi:hypothetical protein